MTIDKNELAERLAKGMTDSTLIVGDIKDYSAVADAFDEAKTPKDYRIATFQAGFSALPDGPHTVPLDVISEIRTGEPWERTMAKQVADPESTPGLVVSTTGSMVEQLKEKSLNECTKT